MESKRQNTLEKEVSNQSLTIVQNTWNKRTGNEYCYRRSNQAVVPESLLLAADSAAAVVEGKLSEVGDAVLVVDVVSAASLQLKQAVEDAA